MLIFPVHSLIQTVLIRRQTVDGGVFQIKKATFLRIVRKLADVKEKWLSMLADLNVCSQKGLVEMFDSSIGAGSVAYAVWWKESADRGSGNGSKGSCSRREIQIL